MKMVELEINIMGVPQGYYLAQGISRDLNFKVGLPAVFEKQYNMAAKLKFSVFSDICIFFHKTQTIPTAFDSSRDCKNLKIILVRLF